MWKGKYYHFFNPKFNKTEGITSLKNSLSYAELCELADNSDNFPKKINDLIFGNPLPKEYSSLGASDYLGVSKSLDKEINWTVLCIRKFAPIIDKFILLKNQFEKKVILGEYHVAEQILNRIEKEICCSMWTLESKLFLLEIYRSPLENKTFLSDFSQNNTGFYPSVLSYYLSNKAEENFSIIKYELDLKKIIYSKESDLQIYDIEYYYHRLNFYGYDKYKNYAHILAYDSYHSVVDRYLTLIRIFELILTTNEAEETRQNIGKRITYLNKKIKDENLIKLNLLVHPENVQNLSHISKNDIWDKYTKGEYDKVINILNTELINNPSNTEYYVLYCKAHLMLNKNITTIGSDQNIQSKILKSIYEVFAKDVNQSENFSDLKRISLQLNNFTIARGIHKFLNEEIIFGREWLRFDNLSSNFYNPQFCESYINNNYKQLFLESLLEKETNSETVRLAFNKIIHGNYQYTQVSLPEHQKKIEDALIFQKNNNYIEAIVLWEELIKKHENLLLIYEESVLNLFNCYINIGKIDDAIALYANSYFKNQIVIQKINCSTIHEVIRKNKFRNVSPTIDLPIFYTLSSSDENELHTAYERFNVSLNIEKPSQIASIVDKFDLNKIVFYLNRTCSTEIFKHSIFIEGTKARYTERINILQLLVKIDSQNRGIYIKELDSLTEKLIILDGLQQLDESKIYVNEEGLYLSELKDFEGLFNRFKTVSLASKDTDIVWLDIRKILNYIEKGEPIVNNDKYSSNPLRDVFEEIFTVVKDKFLNSKFGIAAYLSTRIRHGVLLGEIRPIFEKYNLVSDKDKNSGKYQFVDYWKNKYYLSQSDYLHIQNAINKLSEAVDVKIQNIIKRNLQINLHNPDDQESWFNYYYKDKDLTLYALSLRGTTDYKEFITKILDILWYRTDENLQLIKFHFNNGVKESFNIIISDFSDNLNLQLNRQMVPELYTNIMTCLTDVQNAIDRIGSWFNRSGIQTNDFTLDRIVNVVLENLQHSYPLKKLEVIKNIEFDVLIKGIYYSHFADLFRIFFENILKHSLYNFQAIPTLIEIGESNSYINIQITNSYPDLEKLDYSVLSDSGYNLKKVSSENKSGFHKAKKIMMSDLKDEHNNLLLSLTEDEHFQVKAIININNIKA